MSLRTRINAAASAFRDPDTKQEPIQPSSPTLFNVGNKPPSWKMKPHQINDVHPEEGKESPYKWPAGVNDKPSHQYYQLLNYVDEGFNKNSLIYSAIMYKARQLTAAKLTAYQGDEEEMLMASPNHPLAKLLHRPNPHQSQIEFNQQNTVYLNVAGNLFLFLDRPKVNGLPTAIYSLRPDRVRIIPGDGKILGYLYVPENESVYSGFPIVPDDMIHIKFPNPNDPLEGMGFGLSPITALAQVGDIDNQITTFLKSVFENGMMFSGILSFDAPLTKEDAQRVKARWREVYGGVENWNDIAVLDQGAKYNRLTPTFEEMGFTSIDDRNESRILAPFGVPGILIGARYALERSTFSNFQEARRVVWEDTLIPEQQLYEAEYDYYLTSADGAFVRFDNSSVPALRKDVLPMSEAARNFFNMGIPVNQSLSLAGIDAPEIPGSDRVYVSQDVALAGTIDEAGNFVDAEPEDAPLAAAMTNIDEGTPPEAPPPPPKEEDQTKALPAPLEVAEFDHPFVKRLEASAIFWEEMLMKRLVTLFNRQRRELMGIILGDVKKKAYQNKQTVNWMTKFHMVDSYFATEGEEWREDMLPLLVGIAKDGMDTYRNQVGVMFNTRNIEGEQWFQDYTLQFADPLHKTSKETIHDLLGNAQALGLSVPEMQDQLDELFNVWTTGKTSRSRFDFATKRKPAYRTEMIARTETNRLQNAGIHNLAKEWGATHKEWLAASDARTRETHRLANGQQVEIDEPFMVGGFPMIHPGDMSMGAPLKEVVNCRCAELPVEPETEEERQAFVERASEIEQQKIQEQNPYFQDIWHDGSFEQFRAEQEARLARILTDEEFNAIYRYTESSTKYNNRLRGKDPYDNPELDARINAINNAMEKAKTEKPLRVHRNTDEFMNGGGDSIPEAQFEALVGQTIKIDGFVSTSVNTDGDVFSGKTYSLEIRVPEGVPSAYIQSTSNYPNEKELLLASGLEFKVIDVGYTSGIYAHSKARTMILEVIWP